MSDNKAPKSKPIPQSEWIIVIEILTFLFNAVLNWVVLWYFFAPDTIVNPPSSEVTPAAITAASPEAATSFWTFHWWWIMLIIAAVLQIVFLFLPPFIKAYIPPLNPLHHWYTHLQRADVVMNYLAITIITTHIINVAPALKEMLDNLNTNVSTLFGQFIADLNVEVVLSAVIIFAVSYGSTKIGLLANIVPKSVAVQQGGGGQGGGQGGGKDSHGGGQKK